MKNNSPATHSDLVTILPAARRLLSPKMIARAIELYRAGKRGWAYGADAEVMACWPYNKENDEFWIEEDPATGRLYVRIPKLDKRMIGS